MSDLTKQLIYLIKLNKTIDEISEILKISHKQIYVYLTQLKNIGFDFDRRYYYDGSIIYTAKTPFLEENNGANIITSPKDKNFKAFVISDLHIGNMCARIDLLNKIYDYCAKEGIHIIINCGDIVDGNYGDERKIHDDYNEQIEYAIKNYPFDKSILNIVLLGDHDFSILQKNGRNLEVVLENYRHDIITLGYGVGKVNIKNDRITLLHPIKECLQSHLSQYIEKNGQRQNLILKGGSHKMRINTNNNGLTVIDIPSLSDLQFTNNEILPGAVLMNLEFNSGFYISGNFKQLLIDDEIHTISEFNCYLGQGKKLTGGKIKLEENRLTRKITLEKTNGEDKSQIDKFNFKYGKNS